jgi:twitching motility protein PilT
LRDYETMSIAVTAAEMGILVMGTLHTNGAADRRPHRQRVSGRQAGARAHDALDLAARRDLAAAAPARRRRGRVAALEILINTPAVANLIRQGKLDQLENAMQSGGAHGMRVMDSAVQELLDKGVISGRSAYEKAINKQRFEQFKDVG